MLSTSVLEGALANHHGATTTVSGALKEDSAVATTNDGTFTLTPGAVYTLLQGGAFTNAAEGTLATQITSPSSFGSFVLQSPCCSGPGRFTAGGTLTPQPVGGFTPTAGEEFRIIALDGGTFTGTFPADGGRQEHRGRKRPVHRRPLVPRGKDRLPRRNKSRAR